MCLRSVSYTAWLTRTIYLRVALAHGIELAGFCREDDTIADDASFGFDVNMADVFCTLINGWTVHIILEDIRMNLDLLTKYFDSRRFTAISSTRPAADSPHVLPVNTACQVSRGYLNRLDKTAKPYESCPFNEYRMYHTGDIVRYRQDGRTEMLSLSDARTAKSTLAASESSSE